LQRSVRRSPKVVRRQVDDLRRQPLAALEAPPLEDGAPGPRPHAEAKAVTLLAAASVRLVRALHDESREMRRVLPGEVTNDLPTLSKVLDFERTVARNHNESRKIA
jgi:hypothetical protein